MSVKSETRIPIRIFNSITPNATIFNANQMLETAAKKYGRDDFGDDNFIEGLQILCDALNKEGELHAFGKIFSKFVILNLLRNRLELSNRWQNHPDVLQVPVERPVFIVGPPRSGTTLLFSLLALDSSFRFFRAWEAGRPGLRIEDHAQVQKAKKESRKTMAIFNYMRPELKKIHDLAPEKPEECNFLLANSFEASFFSFTFKIKSYYDWFCTKDHKYPYAYYHKQLQWMQRKTPNKRWLLKAPAHLLAFQALFSQFPDATVLQTHRDLQEVIPSQCSLKYNFLSMTSYTINKKEIGKYLIEGFSNDLRTALSMRNQNENQLNIIDIKYLDLIKNPMDVLRQVYRAIGIEFSDVAQNRALEYLSSNQKAKFGQHHYDPEEFGIDKKTILEKFDFYYQQFAL